MASAAAVVAVAGGIEAANELIFAPGAGLSKFNWKLIPATAGLALALTGLEKISEPFAIGLAYLTLFAALFVQFGNAPAPMINILNKMGYGGTS
jgi:hypothetical protein